MKKAAAVNGKSKRLSWIYTFSHTPFMPCSFRGLYEQTTLIISNSIISNLDLIPVVELVYKKPVRKHETSMDE